MVASSNSESLNVAPSIDLTSWTRVGDFKLSGSVIQLFEWYVLGTPAINVSKRSKGFIQAAHIDTTLAAEAFFNSLNENAFSIQVLDNSSDLETKINELQKHNSEFWLDGELALMVRGDKADAVKAVKQLSEYRRAEASALKTEQTTIVIRRFLNIDTLFRHIRNALAHACFFEFELNTEQAIFMFDLNQSGNLSAVFSLSISRLQTWHTQLERLARIN